MVFIEENMKKPDVYNIKNNYLRRGLLILLFIPITIFILFFFSLELLIDLFKDFWGNVKYIYIYEFKGNYIYNIEECWKWRK